MNNSEKNEWNNEYKRSNYSASTPDKYIRMKSKIKFTTRFIHFQFQVLCQHFFNATNFKDRPTADVKNSAKCSANLSAEH